ncbi:EutN/CcmL family microcompartment protein [Photobacterium leiognathi]|uniref:EutN/CcmL family microcompartment protein n=1 Tax=Photobacterium leiognathi TaxID=553611 RepID=UPI001EE0FB35|nr:EutN/CcmL family microcompartment protein [Photobacterium leiognathi]MCG3884849.1 EutN/CcmL family microcompartment protein [Photobacterium leiognathi]
MILATVTGHVEATQKSDELRGSNLLLVTALGDDLKAISDRTYVAVDSVGSGIGDNVLVERFYRSRDDLYKPMTIVAIVEKIHQKL